MTTLQYISQDKGMKIGSLAEIQECAKNDPNFLPTMKMWAEDEMRNKGIEITEPVKKVA